MKLAKQLNKLKDTLRKIKDIAETYEESIEKRDEYFNNKTENWQESEMGDNYQTRTDEMQDIFNNVNQKIEIIEEAIKELKELTT
jgi:hypothetical protein